MTKFIGLIFFFSWASSGLATTTDVNSLPGSRHFTNKAQLEPETTAELDFDSLPTCRFSPSNVRVSGKHSKIMDVFQPGQPETVGKVYHRVPCDAEQCSGGEHCTVSCHWNTCEKEFQSYRQVALALLQEDPDEALDRGRRNLMGIKGLYRSGTILQPGYQGPVGPVIELEALGLNFERYMATHELLPVEAIAVCWRIAEAVAFLHSRGLAHKDIHERHVFIDPKGVAKLGGHRHVTVLAHGDTWVDGTEAYLAPELHRGEDDDKPAQIDKPAAVFSLVATCIKLITNKPLDSGKFDIESIPEDLQEPLRRGLSKNPRVRPDAEEVAWRLGNHLLAEYWAMGVLRPGVPRVWIEVDESSFARIVDPGDLSPEELRKRVFLTQLLAEPDRVRLRSNLEAAYFRVVTRDSRTTSSRTELARSHRRTWMTKLPSTAATVAETLPQKLDERPSDKTTSHARLAD